MTIWTLLAALGPTLAVSAGFSGNKPLAFPDFLRSLKTVRYSQYKSLAGSRVSGEAEFLKMKAYLIQHYEGVSVRRSAATPEGVFDCVVTATQPSLRASSQTLAQPPAPPGKQETDCPGGTIPLRRLTLDELTRFENLESFFGKSPGEGVPIPPPAR